MSSHSAIGAFAAPRALLPALALVLAVIAGRGRARADAPRRACAAPSTGSIHVDGRLDEAAWLAAPRQADFVERFPGDGVRPAVDTQFAVFYDEAAIYVGVWADDPEPAQIRARLTRRDVDAVADSITVAFDSYHDRRTAYAFQLNAAGVERDYLLFDDANHDDGWDAVWTGEATITPRGWTAEYRIPLDQLRYGADHDAWGLQVTRVVGRTTEESSWSPWPRSSKRIVSNFGVLDCLASLAPPRRLQLVPYASGGLALRPGDRVNHRWSPTGRIGIDLAYGLGPAFTLSSALNPDFGQVEADPSLVNLGPNELFFAEKRPFFLEGAELFALGIGTSPSGTETQFYSRRIGATPDTSTLDYQFLRAPTATTIYGAAKLTGKTADGWSLGLLDAITAGEDAALIDAEGNRQDPPVAALTNFAVGRAKRDFRAGQTTVGASVTAVNRALRGSALAATEHDRAYTFGGTLDHRWDDDAWKVIANVFGSWVHGSAAAIATTQKLATHLWQRPDAKDVHFDPTLTSMAGYGFSFAGGYVGDTKHWRLGVGADARSPGLELNDAGFQQTSDFFTPFVYGGYHDDVPGKTILNFTTTQDVLLTTNFDAVVENYGYESTASMQLVNYWVMNGALAYYHGGLDPQALRGGPLLRLDSSVVPSLSITTDTRRRVQLTLAGNARRDESSGYLGGGVDLLATVQAASNLDVSAGPSWSRRVDPLQYVGAVADGADPPRYVTARIRFSSASLALRVSWTFTPHLSLQLYAQPYVAAGAYGDFKLMTDTHARDYARRFRPLSASEEASYRIARPDFSFQQLRSTLVLRWEYRPGSSVFATWTHGQTAGTSDGRFDLGDSLGQLLRSASENSVVIKASYWLGG